MILKLIHNVILGQREDVVRKQKPAGTDKEANEAIDIIHESMRANASGLSGLVAIGQQGMDRMKMKEKIKAKVKKNLATEFEDEEITEEVTERIMDAAEFDPYYHEMFKD